MSSSKKNSSSTVNEELEDKTVDQVDEGLVDDYADQELDSEKEAVDTSALEKRVAQLEAAQNIAQKEITDWKDKAYRFSADLQNVNKQNELDLQTSLKRGKKNVVQLLLPFVDTLNLSFAFTPETDDENVSKFVDTLKGSFSKMIADFEAAGIEFLVPEIGSEVDAEYMSVLNSVSDEDEITVKRVVGVGVRIDGQLIQEATVMV